MHQTSKNKKCKHRWDCASVMACTCMPIYLDIHIILNLNEPLPCKLRCSPMYMFNFIEKKSLVWYQKCLVFIWQNIQQNLCYQNIKFHLKFYYFYHLITNILMQYRGCLLLSIGSSSHYEFTLFLHYSRNDTNAISFSCSMLSSKNLSLIYLPIAV